MRFKMALVAACGLLALGTAANAQQGEGVVPNATSVVDVAGFDPFHKGNGQGDIPSIVSSPPTVIGGAHYVSDFDVGSKLSFGSGNVAVGDRVGSTSTSNIALNTYFDGTTNAKLESQITAAGFGFYVTD